jgi:arylsulfatase A
VPTIVWQPGTVPAGTVCEELASTMDLLPTFAKLAGGSAPIDRRIDGHDISKLLYGEPNAKSPHEAYYYYQQDQLQAVRSGPWKLFFPVESPKYHPHFNKSRKPQNLLFNVVEDVSCRTNVANEHPAIVAKLEKIAEQAREDLGDVDHKGKGQRERGEISGKPKPCLLAPN